MTKKNRHQRIKELILMNEITNQDMLLNMLLKEGFEVTQATLSRDTKELKTIKTPTEKGTYAYRLPTIISSIGENLDSLPLYGFASIEFSGQLAVVKTRPGYAQPIAAEIDRQMTDYILGTVAGDDTILLIPREGISRNEIEVSLARITNTKK